ncbi:MarR family transcriptional regulator [Natrinema salsiterrestre]|uniref:MarR family transcriptional regulator n=1 Tax=Natrinema salsiterrestre TaxID=2950540 RepID=A0A9Q4L545_9EURY|nr:MarR family transcriptional regulator [Natrinema salsiterrestre]MDF9747043.1 MarR family transcriptional regulator [Natrinema salsiterrestre]
MTSRRALERRVLDSLVDDPSSVVDLAAQVDDHPITVEGACERLQADGAIRSIGGRRYEITASGRRQLADVGPATGGSDARSERESRP